MRRARQRGGPSAQTGGAGAAALDRHDDDGGDSNSNDEQGGLCSLLFGNHVDGGGTADTIGSAESSRHKRPSSVITRRVAAAVVCFRVLNALCLATAFNPDEYWQSLEVAHSLAFGCGAEPTWEWRPDVALRSALHPLVFAAVFRVLAALGLDSRVMVVAAPRVLQGLLAAMCDLAVVQTVERRGATRGFAEAVLFVTLSSAFAFYCLPRTFSTSLETLLTAIGMWSLSYDGGGGSGGVGAGGENEGAAASGGGGGSTGSGLRSTSSSGGAGPRRSLVPWGAVVAAALSVAVRPTALVLWSGVGLGLALFDDGWPWRRTVASLACRAAPAAALVMGVRIGSTATGRAVQLLAVRLL